ncbi:MAG: MFS transporter [Ktedonobacteraceae bacterium]
MPIALAQRMRFARALQSRPFALLWGGQTISMVGNGAYATAIAWQVLVLTGSATAMGGVLVAFSLPQIVFTLLGGVTADRLPRRLVLLWSDTGCAAVVLLIAGLSWLHLLLLWHLMVLSLFFGLVSGFFYPAYQAIPPQLVEKDALPSANAMTQLSAQMGQFFGPLLGAGCVALAGPASAFAFDGLTFLISALCLLILRLPVASVEVVSQPLQTRDQEMETRESNMFHLAKSSPRSIRGVIQEMREGFTEVMQSQWLWVSILTASVTNMALWGPLEVVLPKLVSTVYGSGVWLLGALSIAGALGTIAATFVVGQWRHLHRRGLVANLIFLLPCLALFLFWLPFPHLLEPVMSIVANALLGFGNGMYAIIWISVMQERIPGEKLGRVMSIDVLGSYCFLPIGFAFAGILADRSGPRLVFLIGGFLSMLMVGINLSVRAIRELD